MGASNPVVASPQKSNSHFANAKLHNTPVARLACVDLIVPLAMTSTCTLLVLQSSRYAVILFLTNDYQMNTMDKKRN